MSKFGAQCPDHTVTVLTELYGLGGLSPGVCAVVPHSTHKIHHVCSCAPQHTQDTPRVQLCPTAHTRYTTCAVVPHSTHKIHHVCSSAPQHTQDTPRVSAVLFIALELAVQPRLSELRLTETRFNRNALFFVRYMMLPKLNC